MPRTFSSLAIAVSLFIMAAPAGAEIQGGELTISPFFGAVVYDGSQQLEPSSSVGVRIGYNLSSHWGIEGQYAYAQPLTTDGDYGSQNSLRGEILYHFKPETSFVPFFAAGGGWSRLATTARTGKDATFNYGAGIKYFFMNDPAVALRVDIREVFVMRPDDPTTNGYWQNAEFNFGLAYQFGGATAVPSAVEETKPAPAPLEVPAPEAVREGPAVWLGEEKVAPPGKIMVTELRAEGNVIEIIATDKIKDYKIFTLSQPSRLVIDIGNAVSGFRVKSVLINRLGIATVRFETYPEYLRIFLDAAEGRLLPYRVEEIPNGLRIIVTSP